MRLYSPKMQDTGVPFCWGLCLLGTDGGGGGRTRKLLRGLFVSELQGGGITQGP